MKLSQPQSVASLIEQAASGAGSAAGKGHQYERPRNSGGRWMTTNKSGISLAVLTLAGSTLFAAGEPCSFHPKKNASKDDLTAMARISQDDARKNALATFKDPGRATVKDAELEAENGCLVYSFDIAVRGKSGVQEVQVDAGNGKVLSSKHESAKAEAREKAKDKTKPPGGR